MATRDVYFDIAIGGAKAGRIKMELFADKNPKVVENFRAHCTGEKGMGKYGKPLHYKGTSITEVYKYRCFGGGNSSETIYGKALGTKNYAKKHTGFGDLCLWDNSEFYFTFEKISSDDGKRVVFGQIYDGIEVLMAIQSVGDGNGKTTKTVTIVDCGEILPDYSDEPPWYYN